MRADRWRLIDKPDSWKPHKIKEKKHKAISSFSQMAKAQKEKCVEIKEAINELVPDAKCFIFGSRIDGTWHKKSDYDVLIIGSINDEAQQQMRAIDFGVKVDLNFAITIFITDQIEII